MIEKLKTKLVPKLLALFFIVFELFGVVEIMSMNFCNLIYQQQIIFILFLIV